MTNRTYCLILAICFALITFNGYDIIAAYHLVTGWPDREFSVDLILALVLMGSAFLTLVFGLAATMNHYTVPKGTPKSLEGLVAYVDNHKNLRLSVERYSQSQWCIIVTDVMEKTPHAYATGKELDVVIQRVMQQCGVR